MGALSLSPATRRSLLGLTGDNDIQGVAYAQPAWFVSSEAVWRLLCLFSELVAACYGKQAWNVGIICQSGINPFSCLFWYRSTARGWGTTALGYFRLPLSSHREQIKLTIIFLKWTLIAFGIFWDKTKIVNHKEYFTSWDLEVVGLMNWNSVA